MEKSKHQRWAERLCSRREVCSQELRFKLKAQGAEVEEIERLIAALTQNNFLNEARYAHAFVHDKSRLQGWGMEKIRYALRAKQIPEASIRKALEEIDPNAQRERLRHLLEAKHRQLEAKQRPHEATQRPHEVTQRPHEAKQRPLEATQRLLAAKLIRYGLSRGFAYEEVAEVVNHLD